MRKRDAPSNIVSQTTTTTVAKKPRTSASKKKSNTTRNLSMVNMGKGFPRKVKFTHRYVDFQILQTGAAGIIGTVALACNGMFDPYLAAGGHQPYYFDQLSAIYDHYTVIGSKITVRVMSNETTAKPISVVVMVNDDATVTPTTFSALAEHPSATVSRLVPWGGNQEIVLTKSWSAKKTFGGDPLANDNLQGTFSANPTELSAYVIAVDSEPSTAQGTVTILYTIDYIAVWDELKDIAGS